MAEVRANTDVPQQLRKITGLEKVFLGAFDFVFSSEKNVF